MNDFNIDKKAKRFMFIMMFSPLVGLFGWVFWEAITEDRTSGEIYLSFIVKEECEGKITSIYRQKMNHNVLALKTKNCEHTVPSRWETKFLVGDSISKKMGWLFVAHYRDGELLEILDYHDIAKDMKDDTFYVIKKRIKEKLNIAEDKKQ